MAETNAERVLVLERLEACILACEEMMSENTKISVNFDEVIALARKIGPSVMPPQNLRYAPDQGPLEALPARFRLPFPSQDEMRMSSVFVDANKPVYSATPTEQTKSVEEVHIMPEPVMQLLEEDEFADDF